MHALPAAQISLIEQSFLQLNRDAERAATLFYSRLHDFDPVLRAADRRSVAMQRCDFIRLLGTLVHRLDAPDLIGEHLRRLALLNPELWRRDEHHHSVGAALFWMLEAVLGQAFTPALYAAWMALFQRLSDEVKTGLREHECVSGYEVEENVEESMTSGPLGSDHALDRHLLPAG